MDLGVKGFLPASMLDWDGKLATTIFTGGCNFRCPYCHNADLLSGDDLDDIDFEVIERHLINKKEWLDGVVITGGEPLVNPRLQEILKRIKNLGFKIKIDTNGSLPGALEKLFENKLVDYVAMDIKTSFVKYKQVAKIEVHQNIKKSIKLLLDSEVEHEFRTTVVPGYVTEDDVLKIATFIKGGNAYFLQQFNSQQTLEPQVSNINKYPDEFLLKLASKCSSHILTKTRGLEHRSKTAQAV